MHRKSPKPNRMEPNSIQNTEKLAFMTLDHPKVARVSVLRETLRDKRLSPLVLLLWQQRGPGIQTLYVIPGSVTWSAPWRSLLTSFPEFPAVRVTNSNTRVENLCFAHCGISATKFKSPVKGSPCLTFLVCLGFFFYSLPVPSLV